MAEDKIIYNKTCKNCGKSFKTYKKNRHRCNECRVTDSNNYFRKPQNEPENKEKFHRTLPGTVPIRAYVAKIERYNLEHGTSYTYGQFENLIHNGKIKLQEGCL